MRIETDDERKQHQWKASSEVKRCRSLQEECRRHSAAGYHCQPEPSSLMENASDEKPTVLTEPAFTACSDKEKCELVQICFDKPNRKNCNSIFLSPGKY